jgi:hypothetical protein
MKKNLFWKYFLWTFASRQFLGFFAPLFLGNTSSTIYKQNVPNLYVYALDMTIISIGLIGYKYLSKQSEKSNAILSQPDLQNVAINFFKFKLYRGTVPLTVENLVSKALENMIRVYYTLKLR